MVARGARVRPFPPCPPPPASLDERRSGDSGRRRDKRPSDGWPRRALPGTGTRWLRAERGTGHASANVAVPGKERLRTWGVCGGRGNEVVSKKRGKTYKNPSGLSNPDLGGKQPLSAACTFFLTFGASSRITLRLFSITLCVNLNCQF